MTYVFCVSNRVSVWIKAGSVTPSFDCLLARLIPCRLPSLNDSSGAILDGVEHMVLRRNSEVESVLGQALTITRAGRPVVVEVAIDYSQKTYFTRGVVRTNLGRLPWPDRIRYVLRALGRRLV